MIRILMNPQYLSRLLKWVIGLSAILYFLPFLILGEKSYFTVHDNLDSEVQYLQVLKSSHTMYETSGKVVVPNVMNGLPRAAYKSGFNFTSFLFYCLPAHWAYIFNFIFTHLFAFVGMYLLLRTHFMRSDEQRPIVLFISFLFAILPFYSIYGLSIAGQPILFYAFLNLRNGSTKARDYLIVSLFPFFVIGYLISSFILIVLGLVFLYDFIRTRRLNLKLLAGISLLLFFTILVDYQMYAMTIKPEGFFSHRLEWDNSKLIGLNLGYAIQSSISLFFETSYHSGAMPTKVILVLFLLALSISFIETENRRLLLVVFVSIVAICVFYSVYFYIDKFLGNKIKIIKVYQWNRFSFLLPFLWIFLLGLCILKISKHPVLLFFMGIMLAFQTVYILRKNKEVLNNWKLVLGKKIDEPTFAGYYLKSVFKDIDDYICLPKSSYRIGSLGINPAIAAFNGFYTLDGYQNNYDLNYKHSFRKIIQKDLEEDVVQKEYFDYWGSRCYLISNEYLHASAVGSDSVPKIKFDFKAFAKLGGKYLLSGKKILYPDSCGLTFEKEFHDSYTETQCTVYLYKVK